jgi:hypothetical protein
VKPVPLCRARAFFNFSQEELMSTKVKPDPPDKTLGGEQRQARKAASGPSEEIEFAETKIIEKRNDPLDAEVDLTETPSENIEGRQGVSSKEGKRSSAQKMESTRYNFEEAPASRHVAGAFGKEGTEREAGSARVKPRRKKKTAA